MKRLVLFALAAPVILFVSVSACGDERPSPTPAEPVLSSDVPSGAAAEARAITLLNDLFRQPERREANRLFAELKGAAARGDVAAAAAALGDLMNLAFQALRDGTLSDPPGATTPEEAVAELLDVLLEVAGFDAVGLDPEVLDVLDGSTDGVVAVVAPSNTDTEVVTEEEFAGTLLPAGAVDEPVIIAIQRRTDVDETDCLPLPPGVTQYEGCYQFDVIPDQDFNSDVVVGVCLESGPDFDDVRLHKFRPEEPELGVKPLPTAAAPFLDCTGFQALALEERGALSRLAMRGLDAVARAFLPEPLGATHSGAGGLTVNFSDVGWADDNLLAWDSDRDGNTVPIDSINSFTFPDVFTSSSDGGHVTNLTQIFDSLDVNPKWSPDGSQIAFASTRSGDREVWIMNADGTGLTQVTTTPGFDNPHSWFPSGDSLVITSGGGVVVIATDGTNRHQVIESAGSGAISPDGTQIAVEHFDPVTGQLEVFLVDTDGSNRIQLTTQGGARPSWSPDGSQIAFATGRDGNIEVYVMNADGSNQVNITNDPATDTEPAWSGDGGRIAFVTNRDGNLEIYVMDPDGGDPRRITNNAAADRNPDWIR